MLKITLVPVKIYVLVGKTGISGLSRQIAAKHPSTLISVVDWITGFYMDCKVYENHSLMGTLN